MRWVPGQLGHAEPAGPGAAAAELFGSGEGAGEGEGAAAAAAAATAATPAGGKVDTSTWASRFDGGSGGVVCACVYGCSCASPVRLLVG